MKTTFFVFCFSFHSSVLKYTKTNIYWLFWKLWDGEKRGLWSEKAWAWERGSWARNQTEPSRPDWGSALAVCESSWMSCHWNAREPTVRHRGARPLRPQGLQCPLFKFWLILEGKMLWEMNLGGTIRNFKLNSEKPVQAVCSHRAAPLHALSTIAWNGWTGVFFKTYFRTFMGPENLPLKIEAQHIIHLFLWHMQWNFPTVRDWNAGNLWPHRVAIFVNRIKQTCK